MPTLSIRSAKLLVVISLLLIFTPFTLATPAVFAQEVPVGTDAGYGHCSLHGNYKGASCPKCSSPGASGSSAASPGNIRDPRQMPLQNALTRYNTLVHLLHDKYELLDEKSWLDLPLGTEAEFFDVANQLHKLLVNRAEGIRVREGKVQEELAYLSEVIETYPSLIANLRTKIEGKQLESNRLTSALEYEKRQLELTQRAAKQLETSAYRYQEDVKRDKETVLRWFTVLLPPSMVQAVSPKPYEPISEPLVGGVLVRQRTQEAGEWPKAAEPIRLSVSNYGIGSKINPKPLNGTAEDVVAQLEADATAYGKAFSRTPMINKAFDLGNRKRPIAARLEEERINALAESERLDGEIKTFENRLKGTAWALALARDTLQSEQEVFFYRAADAWIWRKAKAVFISQAKNEVRRFVAAKTMGVKYRDMTDEEMQAFYNAGQRNIFGISERSSSFAARMDPVLTQFQTLRTHALGYVEESVRVAAEGSPREMIDFIRGMFDQIDEDCEQLIKANLGAMRIPEPWQSIVAKYFLKRAE